MMKNRVLRFAILGLIGFLLGAVIAWFQMDREENADAPVMQQTTAGTVAADPVTTASTVGGAFTLVTEEGEMVTEASWPDTYKLVFFGFTYCPDICPATLEKISIVLEDLGETADMITPLFITVDPARDTVEAMAGYMASYDPRIVGLTGSQAQIDQAIDAYKVYAARDENPQADTADADHSGHDMHATHDDPHAGHSENDEAEHEDHGMSPQSHAYLMQHSAYVYLMSPDNQLVKILSANDSIAEMQSAIESALEG